MAKEASIIRTDDGEDTGLRGKSDGSMTVDKTVFFGRDSVKELLTELSEVTAGKGQVVIKDAI